MTVRAEVIVVGLGALGSATARQLALRGAQVVAIDRHHPPHTHGSTHGDTRITRLATAEGAQYVPIVRRSHELWREIEAQTGASLLHQVGALMMSVPGSAFMATVRELAAGFGIAHELLDTDALRERFPMFTLRDGGEGYFEPEGGWLAPEAAVAAQLELAHRAGATLRLGEAVTGWTATPGGGVTVTTAAGETIGGDRLVLCAGPWLPQLLGDELDAHFRVHRQLLFWFAIRRDPEALAGLPVWVWDTQDMSAGEGSARSFHGMYGFPAIDGPAGGLKLATEQYLETHVPDDRQHRATPEQVAEMYARCVEGRLPWLAPQGLRSASCFYTVTPDSHFVVDRHPEHPAVTIVSPCSGHGFKHSAAIGEAVADTVTGHAPRVDLAPFGFERLLTGRRSQG